MSRRTRSAARQRRYTQVTKPLSLQAPYGGLNTRDAIDTMPPTDAIQMDNWFPSEGKVSVRPGYEEHATGMGSGEVETLAEYQSGTTRQLIAGANLKLYNATAVGAAVDISDAGAPYTNNRWQWINFDGIIQFVNGADDPRQWDGTTMTAPAWTGTTIADFIGVSIFKTRVFFWKADSSDFWYGASNAKAGALANFPLSRVFKAGGHMVAIESYTIDSGNGPDDFCVFIMSSGAVIVYQGTDPASASAWSLVGIYTIPEPLNVRGSASVGSDVMIVTTQDLIPLTSVLQGGFLGRGSKISGAINAAARTHKASFGWQVILHPEGRMLIINNPTSIGYDQWVMNTVTGAWCRFKDIEASCWGSYNTNLYFGATGGIAYKFSESFETDNTAAIDAVAVQAWSDLGTPYEKRVALCKPVVSADGGISLSIDVGYDFVTPLASSPSSKTSDGTTWDTSAWDVSPWSTEDIVFSGWQVCSGKGQFISTSMRVSAKQDISWLRTDFRAEVGKNL